MALDIQEYTGVINVKDYGAVGNGVADDSAAIQAAFDRAFETARDDSRHNRFVIVSFPAGMKFKVDSPLVVEGRHVAIEGNGCLLDFSDLDDDEIALSFTNLQSTDYVGANPGFIRDLVLKGPCVTDSEKINSGTTGIFVGGTKVVTTTITAEISASATSITVASGSGLPPTAYSIKIDDEYLLVTDGFGTTTLTVTRGWLGSTAAVHANGATVTSKHSISPLVSNVTITNFTKNFHKGYASWLGVYENIRSQNGYYGLYFDTFDGGGAGGENTVFIGGVVDTCFCNVRNIADRVRFYGLSNDYFYDDGLGGSSLSALWRTEKGGRTELFGGHSEFHYGSEVDETNCPIQIRDSGSAMTIEGGVIYYSGTAQYWNNLVYKDGADRQFICRDVIAANLGKYIPPSGDSLLIGSGDSTKLIQLGNDYIHFAQSQNSSINDLPAGVGLETGPSFLRNGVEYVWGELSSRISVSGTAAVSNVNAAEGSITPRSNTTGSKMKITGAGLVRITIPIKDFPKIQAWGFYLNAGNAGGTITFYEERLTATPKWNGSALSFVVDARGASATTAVNVTDIGTDAWNLISWKNCRSTLREDSRKSAEYFNIVIDTSSMTGDLYMDDFFFATM